MTDSNIIGDLRIPERVTLKKEIGLLSACTIIIGKKVFHSNQLLSVMYF